MLAKTYFERIYPHIKTDSFYPSRRNAGIFITQCFCNAGSNFFTFTRGKKYVSGDVPLQRKIYDGSRQLTHEMKKSFNPFNIDGLVDYFNNNIEPDKFRDIMLAFGIPPTAERNETQFCKALSIQFKGFIDSDDETVDDIVAIEYQRLLSEAAEVTPVAQPTRVLYPGDSIYMSSAIRSIYQVVCDERFQHTWDFSNVGNQTWRGRQLYLSNHDKIRPRAEVNYINIPDIPPGKSIKITADMDARSFEGRSECLWIMLDGDGNECFPNSDSFTFIVDTTFPFENNGGSHCE